MPTDTQVDTPDIDAAIEADLAAQSEAQIEPPEATDQVVEDQVEDAAPEGQMFTFADGTQVPLDEVERGFLRQSDYTRKTQELAQQREQLAQAERLFAALSDDPQGTLEVLQRELLADEEDIEELDPTEAKLREHDEFINAQQEREFAAELDGMLNDIESEFGEYDREAVLQHAIDNQIPQLRAAYLDHKYTVERDTKRQASNAQALEAKRNAPPVAGRSRATGSTVPEAKPVKSVDDALDNALAELGLGPDWA